MPYQCDFGPGQTIYLDNPDGLTVITVTSCGVGQQQQFSTQIHTGPWLEVPQLVRGASGVLVNCVTAQGSFVWQLRGTQLEVVPAATWPADQGIPMPSASSSPAMGSMQPMQPMRPMEPMPPMAPMQMGSMQMSASPMTMRLGNMSLGLDNASSSQKPGRQGFCTQCGAGVTAGDRFCGSCGHQLS